MIVDALIWALLAVGDIALLIHMRRRRGRRVRDQRILASLRLAVRRETTQEIAPPSKRWTLYRAS